jgi:hypothetical protein
VRETVCPTCGERNPAANEFCSNCGEYLKWTDQARTPSGQSRHVPGGGTDPAPSEAETEQVPQVDREDPLWAPPEPHRPAEHDPTQPHTGEEGPAGPRQRHHVDPAEDLSVDLVHQGDVVVTPGSPPATVAVHVSNTSSIVESYQVAVVHAPSWLITGPRQVRLYPGTDEDVTLDLSIAPDDLVPVQRGPLRIRVQGESDPALRQEVIVDVAVGAVNGPVRISLEPGMLRGLDSTAALFRIIIDNTQSNMARTFELTGRDPEHVATPTIAPARIEVPPTSSATARLRVDAPLPPGGEKASRTLTVTARNGSMELEGSCTFLQAATPPVVDPPVSLTLDPSVVRVRGATGRTQVIVDNRQGNRPQAVRLQADDDENAVEFGISPPTVTVPAGQRAAADITLRAAPPVGGQRSSRGFTVVAQSGRDSLQTTGTFIQESVDRRPLVRLLVTVLGVVLMFLGVLLPWSTDPAMNGVEWNYSAVGQRVVDLSEGTRSLKQINDVLTPLGVPVANTVANAGVIALVLTVLALFGLSSPSGQLTRAAAAGCAAFVALFLLTLSEILKVELTETTVVLFLGCTVTFIGGLLARRS